MPLAKNVINSLQEMKLQLTNKDVALVLLILVLLVTTAFLVWLLFGEAALVAIPIFSTILTLVVILDLYRRLSDQQKEQQQQRQQDYQQIEALFSLFFTLRPDLPLPNMRGWAASPDFLKTVIELVLVEKPALIVEAGSGVSTVLIAYCLKRLGKGKVISLDHDFKFADTTQNLLASHGLSEIATVVYAPLKEFEINGRKWLWYDKNRLKLDQTIDFFVIDGPPQSVQKLARYPALPLLFQHLSDKAVLVLDDGYREDEREIVALWQREFNDISCEIIDAEKGAYLIRT
ncbi:MAG TPA: class I SAM-dependent methyltransferase [Coleofasciculaceae cyanobacterium]